MSFGEIARRLNDKVSDSRAYLDDRASAFVSPKTAKGLSGWEFDIPQSESLNLSADITDHYVESGTYLNDHKVIRPAQITLSGMKGELVFRPPEGLAAQVQELDNRLEQVDAYLGDFTPGMLQSIQQGISRATSTASTINQGIDRTQNVLDVLGGEGPERTEQEKAYSELRALFVTNQLVTVQTPWRYFDNMMITSLSFSQASNTKDSSLISVTLKEIRFVDIEINTFEENIIPPREEIQKTEVQDGGIIQGKENSFLFDAAVGLGAIEG